MKLITLLVPAYQPRPYEGATPVPYQSGTVDKFEKQLAEISPVVIRHHNATRLLPDQSGRFAHPQIVTPYQIVAAPEEDAAGKAIALALSVFKLERVTVLSTEVLGDDFDIAAADELSGGVHPWNE